MQRKTQHGIAGGLFYLVAGGTSRLLQLIVIPIVTHAVAPVVFGQYALIRVALFLFKSVSDLGTSAAAVRFGSEESADRPEIFASVWWSRVALSALLAALTAAIAAWVEPSLARVALLSAGAFFSLSTTDALASIARAEGRHALVAGTHLTGAVLETLSVVLLTSVWSLGLEGLAGSLFVRFGATLLLLLGFVLASARGRPSLARLKTLLRFGLPASVAQLVTTLGAMDRWLIQRVSSLADVAAYHLASAPAVIIEVLEQALLQAAEPAVYGASESERVPALARLVRLYFAGAICAALGASLLAPELLALLAPPAYSAALGVVPWLAFAAAMQGGMRIVGLASGIARTTRPWAIAGLVDLTLAAALILVLVPGFGVVAAGAARLSAAVAGALICHALSERAAGVRVPARRFIAWAAIAAASSFVLLTSLRLGLGARLGMFVLLALITAGVLRSAKAARSE